MLHETLRDLSPERLADVRRTIHHLIHKQFFLVSVGAGRHHSKILALQS